MKQLKTFEEIGDLPSKRGNINKVFLMKNLPSGYTYRLDGSVSYISKE